MRFAIVAGMNLKIPTYAIETKISNLYATERWLLALCEEHAKAAAYSTVGSGWQRFIDGSRDRCEMLKQLAHLEGCRITFDWIVPKCVLSYDFECLAFELMNDNVGGEQLALAFNKISRHIAIEYVRLLHLAESREAYSIVMGVECVLETMPHEYEALIHEPLSLSA
ncbi:hypothetical protein [Cerasicoccus frondis]|uniref:hypothetical protein n=1 Tax=Cerasicoccus frondis TaxID=490090 RepID=UPI002852B1C2|nr:hypothetical protein [Cerasicoccus frondis]